MPNSYNLSGIFLHEERRVVGPGFAAGVTLPRYSRRYERIDRQVFLHLLRLCVNMHALRDPRGSNVTI